MKKESIPGWTLSVDEITNGIIKVTLSDDYGRKAEIIDHATNGTIETAIGYAFDIEKQISKNWNLFLFNLCIQKLGANDSEKEEFNENAFGSWYIERQDKRLVYDGKEFWLIFQIKSNNGWTDIEIIKKEDLKYSNFLRQVNMLTEC